MQYGGVGYNGEEKVNLFKNHKYDVGRGSWVLYNVFWKKHFRFCWIHRPEDICREKTCTKAIHSIITI